MTDSLFLYDQIILRGGYIHVLHRLSVSGHLAQFPISAIVNSVTINIARAYLFQRKDKE